MIPHRALALMALPVLVRDEDGRYFYDEMTPSEAQEAADTWVEAQYRARLEAVNTVQPPDYSRHGNG